MRLFGNLILRLIIIWFAVIIAMLAAGFFIGFGFATGMFPELMVTDTKPFEEPETEHVILAVITFVAGLITSFSLFGSALLPVTVAVAISELMRWQSVVAHFVLGGLCGLFVMYTTIDLPPGALPADGTVIISMAAGFVGGFFYWVIAGRTAGNWLQKSLIMGRDPSA